MYIDRLLILLIIGAYLVTPIITQWWTEGGGVDIGSRLSVSSAWSVALWCSG